MQKSNIFLLIFGGIYVDFKTLWQLLHKTEDYPFKKLENLSRFSVSLFYNSIKRCIKHGKTNKSCIKHGKTFPDIPPTKKYTLNISILENN